jgi:elongation factor Ts
MPSFTAKDVQSLRQATGAGMMDAKRALDENGGDFEAATQWLREKGLASMSKRADRESTQGAVAVATDGDAIAMVELRCETDFVAKSEDFVALVQDLASLVAAKGEDAVVVRQEELDRLRVTLKENIQLGQVVRFEGGAETVSDAYLHIQSGRGVNGVLVELTGGDAELAHGVALHIAFAKPRYLDREQVPPAEVEEERRSLEAITKAEGKPEAALPKIVEGRLNGWFKERCLLDQPYVQDEKQSVGQVVHAAGASVGRFAQVVIGQ